MRLRRMESPGRRGATRGSGQATDAQIGAFMGALAAKGESFEELTGAAREMRRKAKRIQVSSPVVVDTCGTGGDGANTFNISTSNHSKFIIEETPAILSNRFVI